MIRKEESENRRNGSPLHPCLYQDDKMEDLIDVAKGIRDELSYLNKQQRDIMRTLVVVVCIIALGKGLMEVVGEIRHKIVSVAGASE